MKQIFLLLLTLISFSAFAQIEYDNGSFDEVLLKARNASKLVFIQLASPSCRECNAVAEKGLSDKELSQLINQTFLSLYVDDNHPDRKQIETAYNVTDGFGILFINNNGTLIHKYAGSSTRSQQYKEQIDIALYRAGEGLKVSELEKEYQTGNKTPGFLEQLLLKKRSLNLNNRELLNEYVSLLPADSLSSTYTLQFIASMGPEVGSYAYKTLVKDTALFHRAWYSMPSQKRSSINTFIIRNSLNKAVNEKDERYAFQVAGFARTRHPKQSASGIQAYSEQLLEYYKRTNDTIKFLAIASRHYDLLMNTTNIDSLKQKDLALQKKALDTARGQVMKTAYGYNIRKTVAYSPLTQRFLWEMKEGAWHVYKRTTDPALLAKATIWLEAGLNAMKSPEALDVYARLLYKQHQTEKAIEIETQAIELKKKQKFSTKENENVLALMQQGLALND